MSRIYLKAFEVREGVDIVKAINALNFYGGNICAYSVKDVIQTNGKFIVMVEITDSDYPFIEDKWQEEYGVTTS